MSSMKRWLVEQVALQDGRLLRTTEPGPLPTTGITLPRPQVASSG